MSHPSDLPLQEPLASPKTHDAKKTYYQWLDYAKGIGILLVVVGHTIAGLANSSILTNNSPWQWLHEWIYTFHMALFFIISGMLVRSSVHRPVGKFTLDKVRTILYPYLIWSVIESFVRIQLSQLTNEHLGWTILGKIWYEPIGQFWFLYSLFIFMVGYRLLVKLRWSDREVLLLAIGLHLTQFWIPAPDHSIIGSLRDHVIYFALGLIIVPARLDRYFQGWHIPTFLGFIFLGYGAITWDTFSPYLHSPWMIPLAAIVGSATTLGVAILFAKFQICSFFKVLGKATLEIYVLHLLMIAGCRILLQKFLHVDFAPIHLFLEIAMGILLPLLIRSLCQRLGITYLFTLPHASAKSVAKSV
ncbi:MAG: acyltransferase [Synechococcales bacterium]|nr:acyltransferase [Synechococcales bacterium]